MSRLHKYDQLAYASLFVISLLFSALVWAGGDHAAAEKAWPMIDDGVLLIDVRSEEQFSDDHIEGAINIDWDDVDGLIKAIGDDKNRPVVLYCRSGNRSGKAIVQLELLGYTHLYNATGLEALKATSPDNQ